MSSKVHVNKKEGGILPAGLKLIDPKERKIRVEPVEIKDVETKYIDGVLYKQRIDIDEFCKDRYEANIFRILKASKGKYERKVLDNGLKVIVDINGKLFNHKSAFVLVEVSPSNDTLRRVQDFRDRHLDDKFNKLYLITSETTNYVRRKYETCRSYEWFENKYKPCIALWETVRQNVDTMPNLYKRQWVVGKKELRLGHKKFFQPENKPIRIGNEWKKQPFIGRPTYDNMFMDTFRIIDTDGNQVVFNHDNWGSIIQYVRGYMKDNAYEFYNADRFAVCEGHVKKLDIWVEIVKYNTINNYYLNKDKLVNKNNMR